MSSPPEPMFTSGFTLGVAHPVGLDNCPDRDPPWPQGHTQKCHCPKPSVLHWAISPLPTPGLFTASRVLPFPECHSVTDGIILCDLFRLTFFTYWYAPKFPTCSLMAWWLISFFFLSPLLLNNIPLSGIIYFTVCSICSPWRTSWWLPGFGN